MSKFTRCDGCGAELAVLPLNHGRGQKELLIAGTRANGCGGLSPLPDGEFDWCADCAKIAFRAVRDAHAKAQSYPWNAPASEKRQDR